MVKSASLFHHAVQNLDEATANTHHVNKKRKLRCTDCTAAALPQSSSTLRPCLPFWSWFMLHSHLQCTLKEGQIITFTPHIWSRKPSSGKSLMNFYQELGPNFFLVLRFLLVVVSCTDTAFSVQLHRLAPALGVQAEHPYTPKWNRGHFLRGRG